jgi:hypothetical protein
MLLEGNLPLKEKPAASSRAVISPRPRIISGNSILGNREFATWYQGITEAEQGIERWSR